MTRPSVFTANTVSTANVTSQPINIFTTFIFCFHEDGHAFSLRFTYLVSNCIPAKHSEEKHPRRRRSYDEDLTSVTDQDTGSAIISVQYRDKAGQLQSLRGNAEKLLIKRRRPHIKSKTSLCPSFPLKYFYIFYLSSEYYYLAGFEYFLVCAIRLF